MVIDRSHLHSVLILNSPLGRRQLKLKIIFQKAATNYKKKTSSWYCKQLKKKTNATQTRLLHDIRFGDDVHPMQSYSIFFYFQVCTPQMKGESRRSTLVCVENNIIPKPSITHEEMPKTKMEKTSGSGTATKQAAQQRRNV